MADAAQKFVTQVAVVNQPSVVSQFTEGCLKSNPVGPQISNQTFPPVRALIDDLTELCFGYAIAPAGLDEHLATDTTAVKSLGHSFGQFLSFGRSALVDCDDRHDRTLYSVLQRTAAIPGCFELLQILLTPIPLMS